MKILILNWRDIKHPAAGGAEELTFEVARRWVQWGHEVTWFTAGFPGGQGEEVLEGVRIIRQGKQITVHLKAFRYYQNYGKGYYDVVIDEINTIPFFTPLYVKEKHVAYINQLAGDVWFYEMPFPLSLLGFLLEPLFLRTYRKTPIVTISESTQNDLHKLGARNVVVVHPGFSGVPLSDLPKPIEKAQIPTVLYVGRVVPSKRVNEIIEAIRLVRERIPEVQLQVVGSISRSYLSKLERMVKHYNLEKNVTFLGRISVQERQTLMKQAHLLVLASVREGWGLVVIEANALGTPAVVYKVHGLVDSVQDGKTGLITAQNDPKTLADQISRGLHDDSFREELSRGALEWSRQFTWQRNAEGFLKFLEDNNHE